MNYLIQPWKHQLEAIERARREEVFALFFEMGAGKTSTTINILRQKFNAHKHVFSTLILCPVIVVENWKKEWLAHSKIDPKKLILLQGSQVQRRKMFAKAIDEDPHRIVITNYEALLMQDLFKDFLTWNPKALVLDESHKCKDPKSKRTKLATELADKAVFKYILSGTPILNTPMDIFSQFRILDGGKSFGKNFWAFRAEYFYDKNAGMPKDKYFPDWRIRPGSLERINDKIFQRGMRITKEECLDLPPLVKQELKVEMIPEQIRLYKEMKKDLVTYLGDKACVATLALTKALRLMQIASGFLKMEDDSIIRIEDNPKKEALKELLSEITPAHKVLVWAVFKENYEQIKEVCTELDLRFVEVHGEIPNARKFENVEQFNTDPQTRVFIGHPGSGGIGINLVSASYSIFFSRTFSLEHDLQAESRNHRGGSKEAGHEKITRIDLVCKDTIEELVLKKLANKEEISESLLRDLATEL